jgi:hypothetical protein
MGRSLPRRAFLKGSAAALAGVAGAIPSVTFAQLSEAEILKSIEEQTISLIKTAAQPLPEIADPDFAAFIDGHADAKVILLGESTHGTDEFYRARAAITERLVRRHGFNIVAVEADWPDAARIDAHIRGQADIPAAARPFQRFPVWMWRNRAVRDFVDRLHVINKEIGDPARQVGFYGLDLYSLPSSMDAVVDFVRRYDPQALDVVRQKYGCLAPFKDDPSVYGALARGPALDSCAEDVASVIDEVLKERLATVQASDAALFGALQNAKVVAASEAYNRAMYEGSVASWNLRDTHMFETLKAVFEARGAAVQGGGLGAQFPYRRRRGDRDGHGRRDQYRPPLPARMGRGGGARRLRHRPRPCHSRFGMERADRDQGGAPVDRRKLGRAHAGGGAGPLRARHSQRPRCSETGAGARPAGALHRGDLPPGNRAHQPLRRCVAVPPVRRICVVRGDQSRGAAAACRNGSHAGELPVRAMSHSPRPMWRAGVDPEAGRP